jgi:polar amino acid transport system permease protein
MRAFPELPRALRRQTAGSTPRLRLAPWHGAALVLIILATPLYGYAAGAPAQSSPLAVLLRWTPLLLRGFGLNILISFMSMAIGTVLGAGLGIALISENRPLQGAAWSITQFFRNAPWLILLFFMMYLLPFSIHLGPLTIALPDWLKAVIGLALPVMANVAEIFRGAVRSINPGQWEAAESLGFSHRQQLWLIIVPQGFRRMIPPWMNLYAILTTSTTLASIVGVNEVVTLVGQVLGAEGGRTDLLAPLYGYVLLLFFIYTYPISWATQQLERRNNVR